MTNWNKKLMTHMRRSYPNLWGNWILNTDIKVGAVGYINPDDVTFYPVNGANITEADARIKGDIVSQPADFKWSFSSQKIENTTSNVSGDTPEASLSVSWKSHQMEAIVSNFNVVEVQEMNNVPDVLAQQKDWLESQASTDKHFKDGAFTTGFCVITKVLYAKGGLNLGFEESGKSFSISGSVSGISSMLEGGGTASASYEDSTNVDKVAQFLWPINPNEVVAEKAPIGFEVAAIVMNEAQDGITVVERWTDYDSAFHFVCGGINDPMQNYPGGFPSLVPVIELEVYYADTDEVAKFTVNEKKQDYSAVATIPENASSVTVNIYTLTGYSNKSAPLFSESYVPKFDFPSGAKNAVIAANYGTNVTSVHMYDEVVNGSSFNFAPNVIRWNVQAKELINEAGFHFSWTNWNLSNEIQVGAVGYMLHDAATFEAFQGKRIGTDHISTSEESLKLAVQTKGVSKKKLSIGVDGLANIGWECKHENSIMSTFNIVHSEELRGGTVANNLDELTAIAKEYGYCDKNGILEGFCVITKVLYAKGGLNVGTIASSTNFSLSGSTEGLKAMTEGGSASASFDSFTSTKEIDQHTFPIKASEETNDLAPVIFEVATIKGTEVFGLWPGKKSL